MCANSNEKTYLCPYGGYSDGANNICLYQKGLSERDFWCMGLYGDLDCTTIDKIIQVKRKKQIVQYAEIIVNGERRAYSNNSSCPYFLKKSDLIGKKFFHPRKIPFKDSLSVFPKKHASFIDIVSLRVIQSNCFLK